MLVEKAGGGEQESTIRYSADDTADACMTRQPGSEIGLADLAGIKTGDDKGAIAGWRVGDVITGSECDAIAIGYRLVIFAEKCPLVNL